MHISNIIQAIVIRDKHKFCIFFEKQIELKKKFSSPSILKAYLSSRIAGIYAIDGLMC